MSDNFFRYQQRVLGILLAWGVGNALIAPLALFRRDPFWRQFGMQAFTWGAIDAALAVSGRRSAAHKAEQHERDELSAADARREAAQFRRILLVNAGLDVLYVASGLWTARRFRDRRDRQGIGMGIAVQGAFLLVYDVALAWDVGRRLNRDR
ncbi:MAG: hypothetical protein MI924_13005 [Chloroflexales bacterium]|nr:hypothetical protein [Chloroflexales bacterium]